MAKGGFGIEIDGFDELLSKLNRMDKMTKTVPEEALKETFDIITKKAANAVTKPSLPRGGNYSSGRTETSLQRTPKVKWKSNEASVEVGFNIRKGGLPSIFMMYGTPRYMKNQALYDAFYSSQTEGEVILKQKEILNKALAEVQGG